MVADPKAKAGHREYLRVLAGMTPEQRLRKAFELSEFARSLFRQGLRRRFPGATNAELGAIELERLERCRNRNY